MMTDPPSTSPAASAAPAAPAPTGPPATPAAPVHTPHEAVRAYAPWIPIRSLSPRHRERILAHLVDLPEHDRYLRFGYAASDEQIGRYVDGLHFERDEVFGVFNRRLQLIALAHLAFPTAGTPGTLAAEFGGSVAAASRGRGYGERLFEHAMLHARNRGFGSLFIHALSENTAMLRIARKAGATVQRAGSESDAYLQLPHDTLASKVEQWLGDGAAEIDYRFKQQAHLVDSLVDAIHGVTAGIGKSARPAEQTGPAGLDPPPP